MQTRLLVRSIVLAILVLGFATPAFANSMAMWVWILPGMVSINPILGLLPTIMVAFIERPFVSLAGLDQRPLIRSLRANLLSLLAGLVLLPMVNSVIYAPYGLWLIMGAAITNTLIVELVYFFFVFLKESKQFRWWWIVVGNLLSNAVLIAVAFSIAKVSTNYPKITFALLPYHRFVGITYLIVSLGSLLAILLEPVFRKQRNPQKNAESSGPDHDGHLETA